MSGFWFLATPYRLYPGGIEQAFKDASKFAAELEKVGVDVYCAISHTHPMAMYGDIHPHNMDMWLRISRTFIEKSNGVLVAKMPTWEISDGIKEEVKYAKSLHKPIIEIELSDLADWAKAKRDEETKS